MSANFQVTEKLDVNAGVTYNKADDTWDWNFGDRPSLNYYNTSELNNLIDSYSDLSYEQYQLSVSGTYDITEMLYASASFTYDIFDMGEAYVYGDEDGDAYYGYLGFGWKF